jgi:predicted dehydrogenase
MTGKIGVGIVGANATRGWALVAHLPALRTAHDYEIRAVSARNLERAQAAATVFGAAQAFDDAQALMTEDDVDLIVVTVKVPDHRAIVTAALNAGKMVFCEWPLGRNLAEAEEMAAHAARLEIPTLIGLQARHEPAVRYVRQLVADGYLGDLLGVSVVGSGGAFGGTVEAANDYLLDPASGASLLSIPAGHAVDAMCYVLGEFTSVSATLVTRRTEYLRVEDKAVLPTTTPDQIAFSGTLESGALASFHYRGGVSKGDDFIWEINGTRGDLILSIENGRLSSPGLKLRGAQGADSLAEIPIPAEYSVAPQVAGLYDQFARDLRSGSRNAPDFGVAVLRHRLLNAIEMAHATGKRQTLV